MLTWLAGPSKGLLLISREEGYLPPFLQRVNKHGVQQNILVVQGNDNPTSEYDVLNVVQEVQRDVVTYDPAIFGGDLGPAEPAPVCA